MWTLKISSAGGFFVSSTIKSRDNFETYFSLSQFVSKYGKKEAGPPEAGNLEEIMDYRRYVDYGEF